MSFEDFLCTLVPNPAPPFWPFANVPQTYPPGATGLHVVVARYGGFGFIVAFFIVGTFANLTSFYLLMAGKDAQSGQVEV